VIFGYSYGRKPGFPLKPGAIVNLLLFTGKANETESFRVESIVAAGAAGEKPPVDPNSVRTRPKDGVLFGPDVKLDLAKQIETKGGAQAALAGEALRLNFPAAKGETFVSLKPAIGRWELVEACEVRVKIKNDGQAPTTPSVQLLSNGGPSDTIAASAPLAAGAETEIVVPFIAAVPGKGVPAPKAGYYGIQKGTGTGFTSDATAGVKIMAQQEGEASLLVESIRATAFPAQLPEWLGKRPPVEGDWVQTFNEDFDGTAIDQTKWNIYGPNWWDKATHWSKDNLIVGNGVVTLHFEKKHGYHNDDPNEKKPKTLSGKNESDYVCGYLDTYGKWVQRYGYFEARVKLPTAPGLWPTFWMVPDRGPSAGPEDWKRTDTGNGAMEFDIMEHLTRWGPHRYNIALHWDGYGKEHKSVGSTTNYAQSDKEGFITAGLLWLPGQAVFYGNGRELFRWEDPRVSSVPSYFIIEFTTGGWDNNAVDDSKLPADYLLDYVRAWQRKDLASEADGFKSAKAAEPAKGQ
jgi:beta-glucanase (GH16 family)